MAATANLDRLRSLSAVGSFGTIAGAARSLGYTASAVSQHLSALEREAGASLLERSNEGVTLTAAGRLLAERSSVILDLVRNAFDDVELLVDGRIETTVVVAAFPTAITSMLLPILPKLPASIRLMIVDLEPEQALAAVAARAVDVAITDSYMYPPASPAKGLRRTTLRTEPIRLVTSTGRRRVRSLKGCADAHWVLGGPTSKRGQAARASCLLAGFTPHVIAATDDHHVTFDVIKATNAVSLLPELALTSVPTGIYVARRLDTGTVRRVDFVTRSVPGESVANAFVEALLRQPSQD